MIIGRVERVTKSGPQVVYDEDANPPIPSDGTEKGKRTPGSAMLAGPQWPEAVAPEAFHVLAGDFVHAIDPHTEADPAALLLQFLIAFGSVVGSGPRFMVGATAHHLNEFVLIVGRTAKSRKGTSYGEVRATFGAIDDDWVRSRVLPGLSSGEGVIYHVRDDDLTGPFCTSRREREFTRRTAGYAHQEVQSRTDRDDTASD